MANGQIKAQRADTLIAMVDEQREEAVESAARGGQSQSFAAHSKPTTNPSRRCAPTH